jgi:hypothetical protein
LAKGLVAQKAVEKFAECIEQNERSVKRGFQSML